MRREQAVSALLQVIAENREASCRAERERAAAEARSIIKAAHAEARKRLRPAVEEASRRPAERLARARAQHRTRERLARQQRVKARLEKAWRLLRESLERSWLDPDGRRLWVERAVSRAAGALPSGEWKIVHPADWPDEERIRVRQWLLERSIVAAFAPDPLVRAGVKLASGHSVLDATLEGLLADRSAVEARLLFHLGDEGA
jgi:vacuolar-type H+-ATPase subunit E/Vma4